MNYIIFDLEWNQPLPAEKKAELPHGEIIQLGFVVADDKMEAVHREEITIKPSCYTRMNPYVSSLTGIKQADIDSGVAFSSAIESMARFFSGDSVIITWGDDDMPILRENIAYCGMTDLVLPPHYNLQRIFAAQTGSQLRQTGLKTAMESLGITDDIKAHDALNDAYMAYLIAGKLDLAGGIAEYGSFVIEKPAKKASQPWEKSMPRCTAKVAYSNKPDALADACRRIHICCPECGRDYIGAELVRQGKVSFIATGECSDHGTVFLRYAYKDGHISVSCFEMTEELDAVYRNRLKSREKRLRRREIYRAAVKKARTDD